MKFKKYYYEKRVFKLGCVFVVMVILNYKVLVYIFVVCEVYNYFVILLYIRDYKIIFKR